MAKFGSTYTNPRSPWKGQIFGEQKFGTDYLRIQDRNKSVYRIPLGIEARQSIGGKSYPPIHKRDWRNGTYHRQDKEITFQKQARDPTTGEFCTTGQRIVRHKYYRPVQPDSAAQLSRRTTFTNGVTAAQALTPAQKECYNIIAKKMKAQTWFSVFMREYLLSH